MLVHICCSVDSHFFLSELKAALPDENFTGFFYNPNIHPREEHDLRYFDVVRSCQILNIPLILGEYDASVFFRDVMGYENEPEKGERCDKCFDIRLVRTAIEAQKLGENRFTTTLLSSPMKEQEVLYALGDGIAQDFSLDFFKINVRKNGGVNRQNELAKRDNLYRQNYCGCIFALEKQRFAQKKIPLELMSPFASGNDLGSIPERQKSFRVREKIEKNSQKYVLTQQNHRVYRIETAILRAKNTVLSSYFLTNSASKKTKIKEILWMKPELDFSQSFIGVDPEAVQNLAKNYENMDVIFGFSKRDDTIFVPLNFVNFFLKTTFKNVAQMCKNPLSVPQEFALRRVICGDASINPVVIVDENFGENCELQISAFFQEEKLFRVICEA